MPVLAILKILYKYKKIIAAILCFISIYFYAYNSGYNKAVVKAEKEKAELIASELQKRKLIEEKLSKERSRHYELDSLYDKAVKNDVNYKCVVPNSLVQYLNAI
jgi:hypothetical protein